MKRTLAVLTLSIISLASGVMSQEKNATTLTRGNIAQIVEGVIYGVIKEVVPSGSLDTCISDVMVVQENIVNAVRDLQSLTFDGIKQGLGEAGAAVKAIPVALKDCAAVKNDLSVLAKMAEIFAHPFQLLWQVGKSLVVNGADIFDRIHTCVECYKNGQFYDFGKNLGMALSEVFFKSTNPTNSIPVKHEIDEKAYDFLIGFFSGISNLTYDNQILYNIIDGKGPIMWGPVQKVMQTLQKTNVNLTDAVWIQLHEVEHIFMEGGDLLVSKQILDVPAMLEVRARFDCLEARNLVSENTEDVNRLFGLAVTSYTSGSAFMVGHALVLAAKKLCPVEEIKAVTFLE